MLDLHCRFLRQPSAMFSEVGRSFTMKKSTSIAITILVCVISLVSAMDGPYDELNTVKDNIESADRLKQFWEKYILPRLENRLTNSDLNTQSDIGDGLDLDGLPMVGNSEYPRLSQRARTKRRGIAGLDNMDIMMKTLDRSRNNRLMSVGGMNTSRLRDLMALQGRRRK